jgi:hypothetical protein
MQNYLNRIHSQNLSKKKQDTPDKNLELNPKARVDINKLLNRVKLKEKSKKKENLILLGIGLVIVSITGLFLFY